MSLLLTASAMFLGAMAVALGETVEALRRFDEAFPAIVMVAIIWLYVAAMAWLWRGLVRWTPRRFRSTRWAVVLIIGASLAATVPTLFIQRVPLGLLATYVVLLHSVAGGLVLLWMLVTWPTRGSEWLGRAVPAAGGRCCSLCRLDLSAELNRRCPVCGGQVIPRSTPVTEAA